jgi:hypothetical protein
MMHTPPNPLLIIVVFSIVLLLWRFATTRRVSFTATKKVREPVEVKFTTKDGDKVSFGAHKSSNKRVPVSFRVRKK